MKPQLVMGSVFALLVMGVVVQAADAPAQKTDPSTDWPCWRGPNGGGQATDPGFKLVDDMSKAKLLWTSDQEVASDCNGAWKGRNL